ncbi:MAG: class I SAM-dependent methyltransferase [Myxococcales bacterium]|nr:class I SAM-dependent methyltransferase [Myxococcales bacterium]
MSKVDSEARRAHREFLNRYYGISRHFYDPTRKYYLFGRDRVLDQLLCEDWSRLLEIGVGTGRNLEILHRRRPEAHYAGLDACDAMLAHTRRRLPWLHTLHGYAEDADLCAPFAGQRPDRVLISYCLSMLEDPLAAIDNAQRALAPGGKLLFVDFADLETLPGPAARALRRWLRWFHVEPLETPWLEQTGARLRYGPMRYFVIGELAP